jgi:hypothetical protein
LFIQVSSNALPSSSDVLTSFITTMVGLSVATERVTQTIKQSLTKGPLTPSIGVIHLISFVVGSVVVALSGQNPLGFHGLLAGLPGLGQWQNWVNWAVSGLLVSGGSAFWNHALDIIQAAKVQKEQTVNAALPAGQKIAQ